MREPPQIADAAEIRLVVDVADLREKEREHDAVRHHIRDRTADAHGVQRRKAEQDIAHMGDGRIGNHVLDVALRERDVGGVDDVDHREHGDDGRPELCAERQDKDADADERVTAYFFQYARVDHGDRGGRARIAVGRPDVQREHREMRAEADEQEEERGDLHLPWNIARRRRHRERLEVERAHPRLVRAHIEEEHTEQHECRADEEEHRHLHRRVLLRDAFRRAPDEHHQVRGHDDHLAEHEKEEHVAHEERPRNAPDDDEE